MDEVLRYIVVTRDVLAAARLEKRLQEEKERKVQTAAAIKEKPVAVPEAPAKPAPAFADTKPVEKKESFADTKPEDEEKKEKPAKKEQKKVSLEELDEKLDKLLDDDIMRT